MNWKDIKLIVEIADRLLKDMDTETLRTIGQEGYYNLVLLQYADERINDINSEQNQ